MKKVLNSLIKYHPNLEFGDYILFQEYNHDETISKPILAIYAGWFIADQTMGFNYVKWVNSNHFFKVKRTHPSLKSPQNPNGEFEVDDNEQAEVHSHIEWLNYIDIKGHWKQKPNWKQILKAYRQCNNKDTFDPDRINWDYDAIDLKRKEKLDRILKNEKY
jgi:hypothetical protein